MVSDSDLRDTLEKQARDAEETVSLLKSQLVLLQRAAGTVYKHFIVHVCLFTHVHPRKLYPTLSILENEHVSCILWSC